MLEIPRHHEKSFCCGAGGGRMWLEEHEERINEMRTDEAMATGAEVVSTGCPFCLTIINDGVAARDAVDKLKVADIAEILANRVL